LLPAALAPYAEAAPSSLERYFDGTHERLLVRNNTFTSASFDSVSMNIFCQ